MAMASTSTWTMRARASTFSRGGARGAEGATARAMESRGRRARTTTTTTTRAFLNFGKKTTTGGSGGVVDRTPYLCIDCGYVYTGGDFKKLPNSYRCPTCNVGKNRFKPQGGGSLLAQKKANKEAFRAKRAAAEKSAARGSGREALKKKMMDAQKEQDQQRGRWF